VSKSNRLFNRGFCALLITQFFGAINDSVLKQVIILAVASGGVWANQLGEGGQAYVALCLTIPFILFSGIAGQIADRISKLPRSASRPWRLAHFLRVIFGPVLSSWFF
jgi:acyl-[acyl-carrier-protein]-phospholipid O-acyltransferase/long-chain-fatty-acid--[acyl-carrier-protein] ligase